MAERKRYIVTFKVFCQADNVSSVNRWAHDFSFGVMYQEGADDVKWSVQELPDDDNDNKEAAN